MHIEEKQTYRVSLAHLGFRPFFLFAGLSSIILMGLWAGLYHGATITLAPVWVGPLWHAHEMIYGYGFAAVAGFLLTATRNWTGVQTLNGLPLLLLAVLWLLARLLPFVAHPAAPWAMAVLDLLFNVWLCIALFVPLYKTRQWKQMAVWTKIVILAVSNGLFYLGLLGLLEPGMRWGVYSGLYMLISLILLMGRRVIPFFIERGAGTAVEIVNRKWADITAIVVVIAYYFIEVFSSYRDVAAGLALLLAALHGLIMSGWYTPAIWRKPLLWVLYIGYGWVVMGFLLRGLALVSAITYPFAIHAFTVGGVGMMTAGMMCRVSLGHTGRDVNEPPGILRWIFMLVLAAALLRVWFPWWWPQFYGLWVGVSQGLWIAGFAIFVFVYTPMLIRPRLDGRYG